MCRQLPCTQLTFPPTDQHPPQHPHRRAAVWLAAVLKFRLAYSGKSPGVLFHIAFELQRIKTAALHEAMMLVAQGDSTFFVEIVGPAAAHSGRIRAQLVLHLHGADGGAAILVAAVREILSEALDASVDSIAPLAGVTSEMYLSQIFNCFRSADARPLFASGTCGVGFNLLTLDDVRAIREGSSEAELAAAAPAASRFVGWF